jgi:hypothetical protein
MLGNPAGFAADTFTNTHWVAEPPDTRQPFPGVLLCIALGDRLRRLGCSMARRGLALSWHFWARKFLGSEVTDPFLAGPIRR